MNPDTQLPVLGLKPAHELADLERVSPLGFPFPE